MFLAKALVWQFYFYKLNKVFSRCFYLAFLLYLQPRDQIRNENCETCHCFMSELKCTPDLCPPCPAVRMV